jgi:hypothetical protein
LPDAAQRRDAAHLPPWRVRHWALQWSLPELRRFAKSERETRQPEYQLAQRSAHLSGHQAVMSAT